MPENDKQDGDPQGLYDMPPEGAVIAADDRLNNDPTIDRTVDDEAPLAREFFPGDVPGTKRKVDLVASVKRVRKERPEWLFALGFGVVMGLLILGTVLWVASTRLQTAQIGVSGEVEASLKATRQVDDEVILQLEAAERALQQVTDNYESNKRVIDSMTKRQALVERNIQSRIDTMLNENQTRFDVMLNQIKKSDEWKSAEGEDVE